MPQIDNYQTLIHLGAQYRHFRTGKLYEPMMFAYDTEHNRVVVVYQSVDDEVVFTRPIGQWFDMLTDPNDTSAADVKVARFTRVP